MTLHAVEKRLRRILDVDWKKEAERVMEGRRRDGSGEVSL